MEKEVARQDALEAEFQEKITTKTNNIKNMQAEFQKVVMKAQQAQAGPGGIPGVPQ